MGPLLLVVSLSSLGYATKAAVVPAGFEGQLRCPFAKVWLEHGPARAARILGVTPHASLGKQRRLSSVWGTCSFTNPFAGETCMEFHGVSWDDATAAARCSNAMPNVAGTLTKGASCQTSDKLAGWCGTGGGAEMTPMDTSPMANTCDGVKNACETWSQGTFVVDGQCADGETERSAGAQEPPPQFGSGAPVRCAIAPGAIGAAHQLGFSPGYDTDCEGTPGQQSPYMWPLRWTALVESKGLAFGSDMPVYESRGRVWYMLDRNWKRLDTWYQKGVQRTVGQSPCESPVEGIEFGCNRSSVRNHTMLHRQNKMVFIDWAEDGSMLNCSWLDLSVVGNIRPDWFMDNRGAATDVQYLGDSHVYYLGEPRLVKQWRKKDFANQYFTMSVQRLPGTDGIHWPLILNIPGEGFGDDFLQHWHGHSILNETAAPEFLLDEAHVAAGGSCPQLSRGGEVGPPTDVEHVPSNLEVDPAAWRTILYTASPVWQPEVMAEESFTSSAGKVEVKPGIIAESCFDGAASALRLSMRMDLDAAVWAAITFRPDEECLMTPRGGGDAEMLFAQPDSNGAYKVLSGPLSPTLKRMQGLDSFSQKLIPIEQAPDFSKGVAEFNNGQLVLNFERSYSTKPSAFHLSFAYGYGQEASHHQDRECFTLEDVPACPAWACNACAVVTESASGSDKVSSSSRAMAVSSTFAGFLILAFHVLLSRPGDHAILL